MKIFEFINKHSPRGTQKHYLSALISFASTLFFFVYNIYLGVRYDAVWNLTVGIYYLLLIIMRAVILKFEQKWHSLEDKEELLSRRLRLFRLEMILLILMDISLCVPISLMVLSHRQVSMGAEQAISIAAYTTYRITMACINFRRTTKLENISLRVLRLISLKDALVSVLTLQNTLISVFGNVADMLLLTAHTSAGMLAVMIFISIFTMLRMKMSVKK